MTLNKRFEKNEYSMFRCVLSNLPLKVILYQFAEVIPRADPFALTGTLLQIRLERHISNGFPVKVLENGSMLIVLQKDDNVATQDPYCASKFPGQERSSKYYSLVVFMV